MGLLKFVDLFSGAGGMSYGFSSHPAFKAAFAVDDQRGKPSSGNGTLECNQTYEANIGIKVREADISTYSPEDLAEEARLRPGRLAVLISCAPCTGFSRTLRRNHLKDDPRNQLVERTGHFVDFLRPKILLMENARELVNGNFSYHCDNLAEHLLGLGYSFRAEVHTLTRFGLPQVRERALVIAVRDNGPIRTLDDLWADQGPSDASVTVRKTIADLPPVPAGEAHPDDPFHVSPSIMGTTLDRVRALPHDGGSWYDLIDHPEADRLLIPSMKRIVKARAFGRHPDVYGRLWWDRPAVTIKRECAHVGNGRYSHPEQDRMCTVRELSLLNGFPRDYQFSGRSLSNKYRHIGDAVPPLISFQLAHLCHWILTGRRPELRDCLLPKTSITPADLVSRPRPRTLFDRAEVAYAVPIRPKRREGVVG
jgi:DNA (cytosine-5)-methyltransferase 1